MSLDINAISQFLYYEASLLDDRQWDEWISCYSPKVVYWMPAWGDDDQLTTDPYSQISLIFYPNRQGLEDRVYRIKTERSGASTPEPRTTHMLSNIAIVGQSGNSVDVRYNWVTHSHRYQQSGYFFGTTYCTLDLSESRPQITRKTIHLNNDYIRQVIDIYHV
ncbi:benzoate 1,2-dioxygenase small subunit [Buttiauxella sp. A2-C1_F]|uniref:benzoate 1,2-dioxygenase small subunit n=1 Tax=Buttiauxella TaxID=82976 RepID=UPI00125FD138|nr:MULTISPECIES: benzoate 1,2-dioxygenase small subunit [Buttiauxella]MCE0799103.1 benzoate 1,2-dioxygenase small subunit [Buttiauxella sp. W03-F01]MCE0844301.1 benzoate 1,2-dioxygenase small subunit [Buttiauxella sp. A2-C1_F]